MQHEYKFVHGNENNVVDLKKDNKKMNYDELKDKSKWEKEHKLKQKNQRKKPYKSKRKIHANTNLIWIMNNLSGEKILSKIKKIEVSK